jgi:hypothetical protein
MMFIMDAMFPPSIWPRQAIRVAHHNISVIFPALSGAEGRAWLLVRLSVLDWASA